MSQAHRYWLWDGSLSIGIEAIDDQHRRIVDYINELEAARAAEDKMGVSQVLIGLMDYTMTHFAFEEELMVIANYPLTDAHKRAHSSFVNRVSYYIEQHESGVDVTRKLLSELKLWVSEHINGEDRRYIPYIKKVITKDWLTDTLAKFKIFNILGTGFGFNKISSSQSIR